MVYSIEQFLIENPNKEVVNYSGMFAQGYGTSKYKMTWKGDWTEEELINYCDNSTGNYGGRIENIQENEDGTKSGTVCVYYD